MRDFYSFNFAVAFLAHSNTELSTMVIRRLANRLDVPEILDGTFHPKSVDEHIAHEIIGLTAGQDFIPTGILADPFIAWGATDTWEDALAAVGDVKNERSMDGNVPDTSADDATLEDPEPEDDQED